MKPQNLQKLIEELEKSSSDDEAYLGIFLLDKNEDEGYLKANMKGLELTAALFLRAILDFQNAEIQNEGIHLGLNSGKSWFDKESELSLNFIEIVEKKPIIATEKEPKWREPLVKFGCIFMIIIGFVTSIIGLFAIGDWLLN